MSKINQINMNNDDVNGLQKHLIENPFQKYQIAEEDYEKREDSVRKFRKYLANKKQEEENKESEIGEQNSKDVNEYEDLNLIQQIKKFHISNRNSNGHNSLNYNEDSKRNEFNSDEDEI